MFLCFPGIFLHHYFCCTNRGSARVAMPTRVGMGAMVISSRGAMSHFKRELGCEKEWIDVHRIGSGVSGGVF